MVSAWKNSGSSTGSTCDFFKEPDKTSSFRSAGRDGDTDRGGNCGGLSGENQLPDSFVIEKIGIGAGKKDFSHANVLRAMILNTEKEKKAVHEHKHKYSHEQEHSHTHCHEEQEIEKRQL